MIIYGQTKKIVCFDQFLPGNGHTTPNDRGFYPLSATIYPSSRLNFVQRTTASMKSIVKIFLLIGIVGLTASNPELKHPGCWVWWFVPDCPLANLFGVDPFHIYPWKKFCKIYSDFANTKVCEKYPTLQTTTTAKPIKLTLEDNEIDT
jgi:hypothetical protein